MHAYLVLQQHDRLAADIDHQRTKSRHIVQRCSPVAVTADACRQIYQELCRASGLQVLVDVSSQPSFWQQRAAESSSVSTRLCCAYTCAYVDVCVWAHNSTYLNICSKVIISACMFASRELACTADIRWRYIARCAWWLHS